MTVSDRYRTPRLNKIFSSYFLVFRKCGVTPHRLYRGSLTLRTSLQKQLFHKFRYQVIVFSNYFFFFLCLVFLTVSTLFIFFLLLFVYFCCCWWWWFSFTDTGDSQDSRRREGTIFYFTLPLSPAHEHSDVYLHLCM